MMCGIISESMRCPSIWTSSYGLSGMRPPVVSEAWRQDSRPRPMTCRCSSVAHCGQRHLAPDPAIQLAACLLLACTTPLLEEERDPRPQALVAYVSDPLGLERSRARARLP